MKYILSLLFLALLLPAQSLRANTVETASFDAMVVLSIADLDDATVNKLSAEVSKNKNAYLEYSCAWSGVVVIKFGGISVGERSDVITLSRRLLSDAGVERGVEVLHVHVEARGEGKC